MGISGPRRLALYRMADEKRALETRNGAIQFLAVLHYASEWKDGESRLTPEILLELQRLAINQIYSCAGSFRDDFVGISGVKHKPPDPKQVNALVIEMCDYVNANWDKTAIHLAAYLMWRINWIHPFFGGNGRTARALAYLALCARLGFTLPGTKTIPELIIADRDPYYEALRHADEAWEAGSLDVGMMESLMSSLLAKQLADIHRLATGKSDPAATVN
jgi:Fic family protein